ncbi:AraC family transcriptional regulator [Anaerocolumna sp. MB42-C2]|uniref:AraC family transcriptional regulator n=1 Tax=Anaerocolumna sp. MB42-C2 TaxID=3070997 RepID=UPI0027E0AD35|nr:AraC family transcriptional regulator [Anaerocolumna sp. MB42-C2]WMJ87144.1 AraC family transcriptional regulator [Anaerocolumna sp. MB42-C2]
MPKPYYEEQMPVVNGERYPFHTFIANTGGHKFIVDPHWHYYIELLYFLEGSAVIILGNERNQVSAGDFIIVNSREVHSINSYEGVNTRYIVIKFDVDILYSSAKSVFEAKYILPFTMSQHNYKKVFKENEIKNTPLKILVSEIYEEYRSKKYGYELAVRINIGTLFLWSIRKWESEGLKYTQETGPKQIDINKLQHLLDYLDLHYNEDISVQDMAKMCNMSYCYFSRFFKKIMHKTFVEYLNYIRITEAKKLLLTTEFNITEVALKVGFSNSSYFIEQFKRYNSQSPKQFKLNAMP